MLTLERAEKRIALSGLNKERMTEFHGAVRSLNALERIVLDGEIDKVAYTPIPIRGGSFLLSKVNTYRVCRPLGDVTLEERQFRSFVVKTLHGKADREIAMEASDLRLGPTVLETGRDGWEIEYYIQGRPLSKITHPGVAAGYLGKYFGRLHKAGMELRNPDFANYLTVTASTKNAKATDLHGAVFGNCFEGDYSDVSAYLKSIIGAYNPVGVRNSFCGPYRKFSEMEAKLGF